MIRSLVHVLISLIIFSVFWTCKNNVIDENESGDYFQIQKFEFGATGLSSHLPWPPSNYQFGADYLLVYNTFKHGLDTLKIGKGRFNLVEGRGLDIEGPHAIADFYTFFSTQNLNVFIKGNAIQILDMNHEYFQRNINENLKLLVGEPFIKGRLIDNLFGQIHHSFNYKTDSFYFFAQNMIDNKLFLCRWDLAKNNIKSLAHPIKVNELKKFQIWVDDGGTFISNNVLPFIHYTNGNLIISFRFKSDFFVLDENTESQQLFEIQSKLFPTSKTVEVNLTEDMGFMRIQEAMSEIASDVEFGSIQKFGTDGGFCRVVRGPVKERNFANAKIYLEIFDSTYVKSKEVDLTSIAPDIGPFFISFPDGLFFKSKTQANEEELNYYFLHIEEISKKMLE